MRLEPTTKNMRFLTRMGMRGTYGQAIFNLAEDGVDFFATTADLARSSGYDRLRQQYPEKYFSVGIAEQNMLGMAAGIAKTGTPVFATTFAPFASFRCADQIKNYMSYMGLNIKLIALDGGLTLAPMGYSHHGIEDMALVRPLEGITLLCPADAMELYNSIYWAAEHEGPVFIRMTGGTLPPLINKSEPYQFEVGKAIMLKDGGDAAIIGTGSVLARAIEAAGILEQKGIKTSVVDMHTIKPLDTDMLDALLSRRLIATVEEHNVIGGLGSAVAEYYSPVEKKPPQMILGVHGVPHAANYELLMEQNRLSAMQIAEDIEKRLR